jgi:hypothetical protein
MNRNNVGCISGFNFHHQIYNKNPHALHRICYYEGKVQITKCLYSLQIKLLTRQGNEDKIRYFYIKEAHLGHLVTMALISGKFRQQ